MKSKYLIAFSITAVLVIASLSVVTGFAISNNFGIREKINWKITALDMSKTRGPSSNQPPVAIAGQDKNAYVGANIIFDGSQSYDPDGTSLTYLWEFSDGSRSSMNPAQHAFAQEGTYSATLTVTDGQGATGTATISISVIERPGIMPNTPPPTVDTSKQSVKFYVLGKSKNTLLIEIDRGAEYWNLKRSQSSEINFGTIKINDADARNNFAKLIWNGQEVTLGINNYITQEDKTLLLSRIYSLNGEWHIGEQFGNYQYAQGEFYKNDCKESGYLSIFFTAGASSEPFKDNILHINTNKGEFDVYLPAIAASSDLAVYVATDGSTYYAYRNGQNILPSAAFNLRNLARPALNFIERPQGLIIDSVYSASSSNTNNIQGISLNPFVNSDVVALAFTNYLKEYRLNKDGQIFITANNGCNRITIRDIKKDANNQYYAEFNIDNQVIAKLKEGGVYNEIDNLCAIYVKDIIPPQRVIPTRTLPTDLNIENLKATDTPTNLKQSLARELTSKY